MNRTTAAALCCAISLSAAPARGQSTDTAGTTVYDGAFFARSQPSSAYDMVLLLPGFRLQEGDSEVRGYSGSAGNVLIDGHPPASKEETLEDMLKRIPARSVSHIDLIRSSAAGVDMQGYTVLANVVRADAKLSGRIEGEYAQFAHGYSAPRVAGMLHTQLGDRVIDLQAARYREIDDEHGFGTRDRYTPDGAPLSLAAYAQPQGTDYIEASGSYRQPLAGGALRASGLFKQSHKFADIRYDIRYPEPSLTLGTERDNTDATEGQVQYDRPIGKSSRIELIAIRRDTRERDTDISSEEDDSQVNRTRSDASETIVRGVFRRNGGLVSLETGAEAARNVLDSHVALTENGADIPLPAADVRVQERRIELFATGTWRPAAGLSVETGLRYEMSRLTQSGDSRLAKSLAYLKPRLMISYAASHRDQLHVLVERVVGQLDFADFVTAPSVTEGTINAGNKNLEPDSLVRFEAAWEHHIGAGSLVLTARHEAISNLVDRVPVFSDQGVFDAAGNIGDARRDEIELNVNLPLDGTGLKGVTVTGDVLARHSRVTDPQTGTGRRISGDLPLEATASITHDLPALHLRWGLNYAVHTIETSFKVDEIERDEVADRVDAFVEYKPDARWTIRLFAKNLTDSPATRQRLIFSGLRGSSDLDYREMRSLRSDRYFGINLQRAFGG